MGSSQSTTASGQPTSPAQHAQAPSPQSETLPLVRSNKLPTKGEQIESFEIKTHSPVPLTGGQEAQVRDLYYKRVRDKCADEIREFAHCATGRTFTIPIICRQQRLAMEKCMIGYATRAEEDAAREEWFATVGKRRREEAEREREKEEKKKTHHEWWGLDEHGRRIREKPDSSATR